MVRVLLWTFVLLVVITSTPVSGAVGDLKGYCLTTIYSDGSVLLEYRLTVESVPANITLRVPRGVISISVWDGGNPAPYSYDDASGLLSFISLYGDVLVKVYTLGLTSKEGITWRFELSGVDFRVEVVLPKEALIVSVEPGDFGVRLFNGTLHLDFKPGSHVRIEYVLVPERVTTPAPVAPTVEATTPLPERGLPTIPLLIVALAILLVVAGAFLALRYRRTGVRAVDVSLEEGLDDRDKLILETIKNMGEATAPSIQKATGIPKTPLYRKLEKLEKLGFLRSEWRGGVKVYKVRGEGLDDRP